MDGIESTVTSAEQLQAKIDELKNKIFILEETNKAHITVINDLEHGALAKFVKWLQGDYERRFRELNSQVVQALTMYDEMKTLNSALRTEAARAKNALASYQDGYDGILYEHNTGLGTSIDSREYRNGSRPSKVHYYKIVRTTDLISSIENSVVVGEGCGTQFKSDAGEGPTRTPEVPGGISS